MGHALNVIIEDVPLGKEGIVQLFFVFFGSHGEFMQSSGDGGVNGGEFVPHRVEAGGKVR